MSAVHPDSIPPPSNTTACELCQRLGVALTKHHLIPRTRHRKKQTRRLFARADLHGRILWLCRPCHNHLHDVLGEKELALRFNDKSALLAHPDIRRFVDWIKTKPAGFKPPSRAMKHR